MQGAAVIGRPDEVRGEEVHAVVVLADGTELEEIERHCRERLAPFKVPSQIEFRADLPKTMVGKVLRRALRDEKAG